MKPSHSYTFPLALHMVFSCFFLTGFNSDTNPRLQKSITSPHFNDNYIIKNQSCDGRFLVVSTPYFCTNENVGCIRLIDNLTQKSIYSFESTTIIGCVYVSTTDANLIIKVPTGIGLSPAIKIESECRRPDDYIEIYHSGAKTDTIHIPSIYPILSNKRFFFTGRRLDRSKILHVKPDTLAIVTCRGLALISYHKGIITRAFTPDYSRLKSFRALALDTRIECFSYPQPKTCEEALMKLSNK